MTMNSAEVAWQDSRRLLGDAVRRFWRRFGGRADDLVSCAHEAFMDAFVSYDDAIAEWSTHLQSTIWHALRNEHEASRQRQAREEVLTAGTTPVQLRSFDLEQWKEGLNDDAQTLVGLALAVGRRRWAKKAVWDAAEQMGWGDARIAAAWRDVERELQCL